MNIQRCLTYAIGSNVKELKLIVNCTCGNYYLSQLVFYVKSIVALELHYCKLESPRISVTFSSLRYEADQVFKDLAARYESFLCQGLRSLELIFNFKPFLKFICLCFCNLCLNLIHLHLNRKCKFLTKCINEK